MQLQARKVHLPATYKQVPNNNNNEEEDGAIESLNQTHVNLQVMEAPYARPVTPQNFNQRPHTSTAQGKSTIPSVVSRLHPGGTRAGI